MITKEGFNKSFIFLLPILVQYLPYSHKYFDNLVDSYIFDPEGKYENHLIIEHKFDIVKPEFKEYEYELISNVLYKETVEKGNNSLYVFKFPEKYLEDYNLFLEGKYSKISNPSKVFILNFWKTIPDKYKWKEPFLIKLRRIFNKDKELRKYLEEQIGMQLPIDAELASTIYEEHETYNLC